MNLTKLLRSAGLICILLFVSCTEEETPTPYIKQGFIKGKITGESADGTYTFNDSFSLNYHTHYLGAVSGYYEDSGIYSISFGRMDVRTGSFVTIQINNISDLQDSTPSEFTIDVWFLKPLNNNSVAGFGTSSGGNTSTVTDFSFNPDTGVVSGKFSLSGSVNSTEKNATITGEFSGEVYRYFY